MKPTQIPTLYAWVGGIESIEALFLKFYGRVPADPILGPVFATMPQGHFRTVAHFVAEVLDDPEFRSALVGYLEWGSRMAVLNSATSENPAEPSAPMPKWGWGETNGPFQP